MTQIKVNFGSLDTGAQNIDRTHKALQSLFDQLQQTVNPVLSTWSGSARDAYQSVQKNWDQLNTQLTAALQSMGQGVTTANTTFKQAEQKNASVWG